MICPNCKNKMTMVAFHEGRGLNQYKCDKCGQVRIKQDKGKDAKKDQR